MTDDRYETFRKFLLSKTVFDLDSVIFIATRDAPISVTLTENLNALIVALPKKRIDSMELITDVHRALESYDMDESVKKIAFRIVRRFFYYYDAKIDEVQVSSHLRGESTSGVSSRILPFPKVGPKSEEEKEAEESKKRKSEKKLEEDVTRRIKKIKIEGSEGSKEKKEEYDVELALLVERIPPEVWWKIFGYLARQAMRPSDLDWNFVERAKLKEVMEMLSVSKAWANLLPEALYYSAPGSIYRDAMIAKTVDARIKGGIKKLDLASHPSIAVYGGWYDLIVGGWWEEDPESAPTVFENMAYGRSFFEVTDLSFVRESFGLENGGIPLITDIEQTWKIDLSFLEYRDRLERLEIRGLTTDLTSSVTKKLVNLTSLSLSGWSGISEETGARVYMNHWSFDREQVDKDVVNPIDNALWSLKRLKRLKIKDVPTVTLPGLLRLTNLTRLYHEGLRCDNPIVKSTGDHAYKLSHMTSLTMLKLTNSFVSNVSVLPANSTFPVVFDDTIHYDPMKDLKNMSAAFASLRIFGRFSEIVLDESPMGLRELDLSGSVGTFRFFDPMRRGKTNVCTSLTKLNVVSLVCEQFTYEGAAKASIVRHEEGEEEPTPEILAQADLKATIARNATHRNAVALNEIVPNLTELAAWDEFDLTSLSDEIAQKMRSLTCAVIRDRNFRIPVPPLELTRFENLQKLTLGGYFFPTESCVSTFASTLTELTVLHEQSSDENKTPKAVLDVLLHDVKGDRSLRLFTNLKSLVLKDVELEIGANLFNLTRLTKLSLDRWEPVGVYLTFDDAPRLNELVDLNTLILAREVVRKSDIERLTNLTLLDVNYLDLRDVLPELFEPTDFIDTECVDFLPNLKTLNIDGEEAFSDLT